MDHNLSSNDARDTAVREALRSVLHRGRKLSLVHRNGSTFDAHPSIIISSNSVQFQAGRMPGPVLIPFADIVDVNRG